MKCSAGRPDGAHAPAMPDILPSAGRPASSRSVDLGRSRPGCRPCSRGYLMRDRRTATGIGFASRRRSSVRARARSRAAGRPRGPACRACRRRRRALRPTGCRSGDVRRSLSARAARGSAAQRRLRRRGQREPRIRTGRSRQRHRGRRSSRSAAAPWTTPPPTARERLRLAAWTSRSARSSTVGDALRRTCGAKADGVPSCARRWSRADRRCAPSTRPRPRALDAEALDARRVRGHSSRTILPSFAARLEAGVGVGDRVERERRRRPAR